MLDKMEAKQGTVAQADDDYVAWCRYAKRTIVTCDSDAEGAFRVYRRSQWIPVSERLPPAAYSVPVWVTGGRLHLGCNFLDVGTYFGPEQGWRTGMRKEDGSVTDEKIEVSHWLDTPEPGPTDELRDGDQATPGAFMQATRVEKSPHLLEPGEFTQADYGTERKVYFAKSPNGLLANLARHSITEHEDGTITVAPSILVRGGSGDGEWHGYLERGVWRECQ